MSSPDENEAKTDTKPLLDAARAGERGERAGNEPRHAGQAAMEEALRRSGRTAEDLTAPDQGDDDRPK
ncbi:hypothetical protein [Nonomuraea candida]|uniref:hypothetical protein n=1 Tax=Nonomuraea candida TaxID=359159 RepID=UPI0005BC2873|nr:hypothetical protein [Nonomuraea candida]